MSVEEFKIKIEKKKILSFGFLKSLEKQIPYFHM
jgi:hypothetical protein